MSEKLKNHIIEAIRHQDGFLSFDQFMNLALYAPGLGYYTRAEMDFGSRGDFITAPECSTLFGQCIAKQAEQVLGSCRQGVIFELGAGSGKLAADILAQLSKDNALPHEYWILECSGSLRALQQETLRQLVPECLPRVKWLDTLPNVDFEGFIFGNEVLDAMAVQCVSKSDSRWMQRGVGEKDGALFWAQHLADKPLTEALLKIESAVGSLPDGYQTEINLATKAWLEAVSAHLKRGLILLIDYGYPRQEYYRPDRITGTLMCYHQHKGHDDPFVNVGEQDITAHVDFTSLAEGALELDLTVAGYCTQMMFLAGCGIEHFALQMLDPVAKRNELMRLMHPTQMGEQFKCIAFSRNQNSEPLGFVVQDLRHLL